MDTQLKKRKILTALFTAILIAISSLFSTPSNAATSHPKALKAACRIEIGNAHLSTHLREAKGFIAVKVNAVSICNIPQIHVKLTVQIYKVGFFRDYLVSEKFTNPLLATSSGMRVENLQTFRRCASAKKSAFYGIAFAEALIAGQKSAALPARSPKNIPLDCGT